jgi:hypothetical protein
MDSKTRDLRQSSTLLVTGKQNSIASVHPGGIYKKIN